MKKSNKILLGGFLTIVLLISIIHITLYARYKKGHFVVNSSASNKGVNDSLRVFANVRSVVLRNMHNSDINLSDDNSVEKMADEDIEYTIAGDSLVIDGSGKTWIRNQPLLRFSIPVNAALSLENTNVSFQANSKNIKNNASIKLTNSTAMFSGINSPLTFAHVKVLATSNSVIGFHEEVVIDSLEIQLVDSSVEETGASIGSLSITTDSLSRIAMQSVNLLKGKITTLTH